jgi:tRNA-splicing ligase RtcB (3'-phosphate/5'-hydroxy nucleic acid ligase)
MAFMARVERHGEGHYVLPRAGDMRADVHAFLSEALYAQTDEALWRQVAQAASYPGIVGFYLMPDTHLGYGIPVGGVAVTDDVIIQAGSGYDISCGVVCLRVPGLHASDVADWERRRQWICEVEKRVATGVGSRRPRHMPRYAEAKVEEIFRYGAQALGVPASVCERQYVAVDADALDTDRVGRARARAAPQLGSVGGGNHFVEMQVDAADGSVWVMIHCGSRGYGWQTANYYFYAGAELRGLPSNRREESWLRADEPLGREYWAHHNSAANYAVANRHVIVRGVEAALEAVYAARGEVYYEISHNLVQRETLVLPDGTTRTGFVHRKGATRAFPAGHPDLAGTVWADTGHPCLVPGSMFQGAAILYPLTGAHRSACSVNHGAGRVMARGRARVELAPRQVQIDTQMREIRRTLGGVEICGIAGNTAHTPLDECGHVYKDLDAVLDVLQSEGIARVAQRLYPVANIKGLD